jgi:magnesium chelatase subunit I
VLVPQFMKEVLEEAARLARSSPAINQQSGVSVRMSIANYETMISNAERRGLLLDEDPVVPRLSDLIYLAASSRGKIELTLSEDDGQEDKVVAKLVGEAVKNIFESYFEPKHFRPLIEWFEGGKTFVTGDRVPVKDYVKRMGEVAVLAKEVAQFVKSADLQPLSHEAPDALAASVIELILEGLHVENRLNKAAKGGETVFKR